MLEGTTIQEFQATQTSMAKSGTASGRLSPQAFDELFLGTYPRLVGILRRMLGDCGRAEELASEAFFRLHTTTLPPAARENVAGWLYRTAMRLGIDDLRARARHVRLQQQAARTASIEAHDEDGLQALLRSERQERVRVVLARLKPVWAELLLLRATGHSYREIARNLGIAPSSVGTLLLRAEAAFEKNYVELSG